MSREGILYLSRKDVEQVGLSMNEVITCIEDALKEKYFKRVEMPPKPGIHPKEDTFIHAMPAYLPKIKAAGMKWISGYPKNPAKGLPYITGLLILNDVETGLPICVMDGTWVTAKRTGAVTAISAKFLARRDSEVIGIVGCGVQGKSNLEALSVILNIKKVKAYDIVKEKLKGYVKYVKDEFGYDIIEADEPKDAIKGSDIIITATPILKKPNPVAKLSWVKNGALICPIEFDSYWDSDTFSRVDKLCTDDSEQLNYYKTKGYFLAVKKIYAELSELVIGAKKGREDDEERITTVNLGLALADIAVGKAIYDKALRSNVGVRLPY
jgi:ornithine cyclodeaminase/alanine dehydrogenase